MSLTKEELLDLKEQVDDAKTTVSELTGQETALLKQFKEDWGCNSAQEVEKKMGKMKERLKSFDKKIEKAIEEIENEYSL